MKRQQKIIITAVILLPIVIGSILLMREKQNSPSSSIDLPSAKKIGLVRIEDAIYTSEKWVKQLSEYRTDNSIAGVIIKMNSPGGTAAPTQEIYHEVMRFREANKPVVVSMENVAASGGYYIASAAQTIFADAATITGSIGVYMRFPYWEKLFDKIGVESITIKAGALKDVGNPERAMTDTERAYLQDVVNDMHDQFIGDVALGRGMKEDSIKILADGRIYTGRKALAVGLVDTLGGYQEALAYLKKECNLPEKTKVDEKTETNIWKELMGESVRSPISKIMNALFFKGAFFMVE